MPVKVTIKRDAYLQSVARFNNYNYNIITSSIIYNNNSIPCILPCIHRRREMLMCCTDEFNHTITLTIDNIRALYYPCFNMFMILIISGLHAYISAITIFQLAKVRDRPPLNMPA